MGAGEVTAALIGLLGALIGAVAGYLGSVRAASRTNRPAWASVAIEAARSLLASDDPEQRAEGARLLEAAGAAIRGAPDAPDQLRSATRDERRELALERARSSDTPVTFTVGAPQERAALARQAPQDAPGVAPLSPRDVDAARAEVLAFRAARLTPDTAVLAMARARPAAGA